jgi:hypothetical protein
VKVRNQAEFLIYEQFPFDFTERIAVQSSEVKARAAAAIARADHRPTVDVLPAWYFLDSLIATSTQEA